MSVHCERGKIGHGYARVNPRQSRGLTGRLRGRGSWCSAHFSSDPRPSTRDSRLARGLTLIELLVVIIILTTVVAAAIPILTPSNNDRRLRETSRTLNTFITGAQARAISLGRPYGIALKRLSADTGQAADHGVCLEVFYVEQAAPFTGFDRKSKACVSNLRQLGLALVNFVTESPGSPKHPQLPIGILPDLFADGLLRPGDVMEINGTRFELVYLNNDRYEGVELDKNGYFKARNSGALTQVLARPLNDSGQQIKPRFDSQGFALGVDRPAGAPTKPPEPYWTAPAPYRVLRQASLTSDDPYQLPEGTAIDLRASSVGSDADAPGRYFYVPGATENAFPVTILFAPEGRVARVAFSQLPLNGSNEPESFDEPVVDNVYLLVGNRENVPTATAATDRSLVDSSALSDEERDEIRSQINWLSGTSRWLVIGSQSGRVVTVENALVDLDQVATNLDFEVRRNEQIKHARDFTREMSQIGGR